MESTRSDADFTTALPLEIDETTAIEADNLLREFAEAASLETAMVVDRSGALVSGISAEEFVTIDLISALIAGASGAMRALVSRLGETGSIESLHLGEDRLIYLKEVREGFILVGVADTRRPAALVRQSSLAIESRLSAVLEHVTPRELAPPEPEPKVRYHNVIPRLTPEPPAPEPAEEEEEALPLPIDPDDFDPGPSFADLDLQSEVGLDEAPPEPEPSEILEPLLDEEPEIVVEPSFRFAPLPVDSPFEPEEEEEAEESVPEPAWPAISDEVEELPLTLSPSVTEEPIVFELDEDDEDDEEEEYDEESDEEENELSGDSDDDRFPAPGDFESLVDFEDSPEEFNPGDNTDEEAEADETFREFPEETDAREFNPFAAQDSESLDAAKIVDLFAEENEVVETSLPLEMPQLPPFIPVPVPPEPPTSFFHRDSWIKEDDESEAESFGEKSPEDEIDERIKGDEEEQEHRSSGPFYF